MIELPLVFMAGILGTAHCLGMCGPLALAIGGVAPSWNRALARQTAYTSGRLFSYAVLGASAGFCGARLTNAMPVLVQIPALLALVAGTLLVYQGLQATGLLKRRAVVGSTAPCLASGFFGGFLGSFLRRPNSGGAFLAGVFTGFLPCGLLYGMLALAMSTHSVVWGTATMFAFGLGTAPVMILAGVTARLFSVPLRRRIYTAAAWCLVLTGVVSIARGMSIVHAGGQTPSAACPLCRP